MNLNQLEYFIAVAETLNFTKAAAKCYISQTAMTQQIRALEKIVGVPLFIRDKHHVELTVAGRVYLNEARVILDRSNDAMRLAKLASEGATGELKIGYINGFGQSDLSESLRSFHQAYPNIKLHLQRNNMSVLLDALDRGELDLVFAVSPRREYAEIERRYLRSYPVLAVLPANHLLGKQDQLTYQDLKNENFIMMQPGNRPKDQMEESMLIYERGGYLPNVVAIEGDQENLLLMISIGMGISLLPEYIMRYYQRRSDLKVLPMIKQDGTAETLDLEVSWQKDSVNPAVWQFLTLTSKNSPSSRSELHSFNYGNEFL